MAGKTTGGTRGRRGQFTANLPNLTANATTEYAMGIAPGKVQITALRLAFGDVPASGGGTVLGNFYAYDDSGNDEDRLNETADYNLEGMTNDTPVTLPVQTTTPADLILDEGDMLYFKAASNNGDMTDGKRGCAVADFVWLE